MTSWFSFHRSVAWATAGRVTLVGDDGGGRSNLYSFDVADAVARAEAESTSIQAQLRGRVEVAAEYATR